MLVLQGFPVCHIPPLTTEQVMEKQRRRAKICESMQATRADKRANGKKLKKCHASPRRL